MTFLFRVPQVRARSLGANLGAADDAGMLILFVILSEVETSRSEVSAESKDPYSVRVYDASSALGVASLTMTKAAWPHSRARRIISSAC